MAEALSPAEIQERLGELDNISDELIEDIQQSSPGHQMLDEVMRSMGMNRRFEVDPTIERERPGPESFEELGLPSGETPEGPSTPVPEHLQGPPPGPMERVGSAISGAAGAVKRTGLMVIRGAGEAAVNAAETATDLSLLIGDFIEKNLTPEFILQTSPENQPALEGDDVGAALTAVLDEIVRAPEGAYEETVRDVASVLSAMLPMVKGLQAAGLPSSAATLASGTAAEMIAIDPESPSFVDMIGLLAPGIQQAVKDYIRADVPDDQAEQDFHDRLRLRGFRGVTDGIVADGLWRILGKVVGLARAGFKAKKAGGEIVEEITETGERIALPPGRFAPESQPQTVVGEIFEEQAQRGGPLATRPATAPGGTPGGPGAPRATPALPSGEAAGLLPPGSINVANEALDIINQFKAGFSEADLDTVSRHLAQRYNLTPADTRELVDAGLNLMREAREKLGSSAFDRTNVGIGALIGAGAASQLVQMPEDEEGMKTQLTQAGIGGEIAEAFVNALKKLKRVIKPATKEEAEKLTYKKKFVPDEPAIKEVTEEDTERAAKFLADQPERVIIQGKPRDINFRNIQTGTDLKKEMDRLSQLYSSEIEQAVRHGTPRNLEAGLAREMGMTVEELQTFAKASEIFPKVAFAARDMLVASSSRLKKLKDAVLSGDLNAEEAYLEQFIMHGELHQSVSKIASEFGRSLGMYNVKADGAIEFLRNAKSAAKGVGQKTGVTVKELAKMHDQLSKRQEGHFLRQLTKPTTLGAIQEYWYNSILMGAAPVNLAGNLVVMGMEPVERAIQSIVPGSPVRAGEAVADVVGMVQAFGDAMSLLARSLVTEEAAFENVKAVAARNTPQITNELFGLQPDSMMGGAVNMFGKVYRTMGGGLLRATDDAFKLMHMRGELRARAYREVRERGLTGDAAEQFTKRFMENPPDEALDAAMKRADYWTFTNSLADPEAPYQALRGMAQGINNASVRHPIWKFLIPFMRASVNLPSFSMERLPVLGQFSRQVWRNLRSNDPELRAQTWAKLGTAMGLSAFSAMLTHQGLLVGSPPSDPRLRRMLEDSYDIQFNSIKIGSRWVSLDRFEPLGWILQANANVATWATGGSPHLTEEEQRSLADAVVLAQMQMLESKTWLTTVSQLMDAVRGGRYNQGELEGIERFFANFGSGFVPASSLMTRVRQANDNVRREFNSFWDPIKNKIPGLSTSLPPQVNAFGEDVLYTHGWHDFVDPALVYIAPYATKNVKQSEPARLVTKHKLRISMPGNVIQGVNIGDKDANPWWKYRYRKLAGKEVKIGGRSFGDAIVALSKMPAWDRLTDGPDGGKQILVDDIRRQYTRIARIKLLREFKELRQRIREEKIESIRGRIKR